MHSHCTGHAAWPSKVIENCQVHEYDRNRTSAAQIHAQNSFIVVVFVLLFQSNKFNNTKHQHYCMLHHTSRRRASAATTIQQLHRFTIACKKPESFLLHFLLLIIYFLLLTSTFVLLSTSHTHSDSLQAIEIKPVEHDWDEHTHTHPDPPAPNIHNHNFTTDHWILCTRVFSFFFLNIFASKDCFTQFFRKSNMLVNIIGVKWTKSQRSIMRHSLLY